MDHSKRRDEELPYISDEKVFEEQKRARRLKGWEMAVNMARYKGE